MGFQQFHQYHISCDNPCCNTDVIIDERTYYENSNTRIDRGGVKVKFTLKQEHIDLLSHAYVEWDDCETGAPAINPKRPYGNSNVSDDVIEILGWNAKRGHKCKHCGEYDEDLSGSLRKEAIKLHYETEKALAIILSTKQFIPGEYEGEDTNWRLIRSAAAKEVSDDFA